MAVPTLSANTPTAGKITWAAFSIQYGGVTYSVPSSNTDKKFVYWLYNAGAPTLNYTDDLPDLGPDDLLLFLNKTGIPVNVQFASVIEGSLIVEQSILADAIGSNQISTRHLEVGAVKADNIDVNVLTSGFTITGKIQVGTHTWTPNEGFIIPGVVILPGNSGGQAQITAAMTATSLTVQKDFNLLGNTNSIAGTLTLSNGITRPTAPASVYQGWNLVGAHSQPFGPIEYGLCASLTDSSVLLTGVAFFDGGIKAINKSDGQYTFDPASANPSLGNYRSWLPKFQISGGITTYGGAYYVLGLDFNRGPAWYVYQLDTSFNKTAEWAVPALSGGAPGRPAIGDGGGALIVAWADGANTIYYRNLSPTTGWSGLGGMNTFTSIGSYPISHIGYLNYDFGTSRMVISVEGIQNFVCDNAGNRLSDAYIFPSANGHSVRGMWWDGTRFWSYGGDGTLYKHGSNPQQQVTTTSYSWYDANATGGTHETEESTTPTSFTRAARTYLNVNIPEAPNSGNTNAGETDKANQARIYVGVGAGARRLQSTQGIDGSGRTIRDLMLLDAINTGSATSPGTNGFAGAANSPGIIKSYGAGSGQGIILNGDGSASLGNASITTDGISNFLEPIRVISDGQANNLAFGGTVANGASGTLFNRRYNVSGAGSGGAAGSGELASARHVMLKVHTAARSQGLQACDWWLEYQLNTNAGAWTQVDRTLEHNNNDQYVPLGTVLTGWVTIPAGTTLLWVRARYTVGAGGFSMFLYNANLQATMFR